jgi:hypothetical protein
MPCQQAWAGHLLPGVPPAPLAGNSGAAGAPWRALPPQVSPPLSLPQNLPTPRLGLQQNLPAAASAPVKPKLDLSMLRSIAGRDEVEEGEIPE